MININGKSYSGDNLSVINGVVYIDGNKVDSTDEKVINISVEGNVDKLEVDSCNSIRVAGDCGTVNSKNGNLSIGGNVGGDVTNKNGNITCSRVGGSVDNKNGNISYIKLPL